jgi:hypothetical protein
MSSHSPLHLCLHRLRRRGAILLAGILLALVPVRPTAGFAGWTDDGARIDPNG